jgi:hypothetical protein
MKSKKTKVGAGSPSHSIALLGEIQRLLKLCSGREFRNPKAGKWTIELEFCESGPSTNLYSVLEHVRNSPNAPRGRWIK